jgi:RND family efflux transporter MFP subunit
LKASITAALLAATIVSLLSACARQEPPAEAPRPVRATEIRYGAEHSTSRYFASVQSRYEVEQAFRVGAKVVERRVDVGQSVREGDVIARLDDTDYRLAEEAARQQLAAAETRRRQAESDWRRLQALKLDGSVAELDDEHAQSELETARAAAGAQARELELARNQVEYTTLRASSSGVVTSVRFEVGQVLAAGQPIVTIADEGEPEIVADVPEDHLEAFKNARYSASLSSSSGDTFDVVLRELSAQATAQTRTYRARLKPATPRPLPLGASATLVAERAADGPPVATIPASALTQSAGQPALWAVRQDGLEPIGTVELIPVNVHGYRNDEALVSGPPASTLVVTAGVQKMATGLRVALPPQALNVDLKQAAL